MDVPAGGGHRVFMPNGTLIALGRVATGVLGRDEPLTGQSKRRKASAPIEDKYR